MNADQLREIYAAATPLRPADSATDLDQACAGDAALRRHVEKLLQQEVHADAFFATAELPAPFAQSTEANRRRAARPTACRMCPGKATRPRR